MRCAYNNKCGNEVSTCTLGLVKEHCFETVWKRNFTPQVPLEIYSKRIVKIGIIEDLRMIYTHKPVKHILRTVESVYTCHVDTCDKKIPAITIICYIDTEIKISI